MTRVRTLADFNPSSSVLAANVSFTNPAAGGVARPALVKLTDFVAIEDFGAVGDRTTDDTAAFNAWLAALQGQPRYRGYIRCSRTYRIASEPPAITGAIAVDGPGGVAAGGFLRDYNGSGGRGLFHLTGGAAGQIASNSRLSNFYINSAAGRSGGALISMSSTATDALSGCVLEDLWLSTEGSNTHTNTIYMNGTAKATGAIGIRDTSFRNLQVFGSFDFSVAMIGVVGLDWFGGGVYAAGGTGTNSGGIQLTGNGTVKSQQITMEVSTCNGFNLTQCMNNRLGSRTIGAIGGLSVNNDATCSDTLVVGKPSGTVSGNWVGSGILRPTGYATT